MSEKFQPGDVVLIEWKDNKAYHHKMKKYDFTLGIVAKYDNPEFPTLLKVQCRKGIYITRDYWYWFPSSLHLISKGDFK